MLVRDRRDVAGVRKQARDEAATRHGKPVLTRRREERVLLTLEEREMRVHARPRVLNKGLGMKVATNSSRRATSSMTVRAVIMLSAARTGSTARRSISFWPGPPSW